ncbi:MAG: hypothetical protein M1834_000739 [Cirrosporium novae-zelandiae]|nr:MAG: hypothetical protein M1834_000739 [Cirrosporium novae-zelandiae]
MLLKFSFWAIALATIAKAQIGVSGGGGVSANGDVSVGNPIQFVTVTETLTKTVLPSTTWWPSGLPVPSASPLAPGTLRPATCPGGDRTIFTDTNGIKYTLACASSLSGSTISSLAVSTFAGCIAACSTYSAANPGSPCSGVAYMDGAICSLKGGTLSSAIPHVSNVNAAILYGSTLPPSTPAQSISTRAICPSDDGANYTSTNGGIYRVACRHDTLGATLPNGIIGGASLQSCIESCAMYTQINPSRPCVAVTFYGICYLKGATGFATSLVGANSAQLTKAPVIASTSSATPSPSPSTFNLCPGYNGVNVAAKNGDIYVIMCNMQAMGAIVPNGANLLSSGLADCIQRCSVYNKPNPSVPCLAVTYTKNACNLNTYGGLSVAGPIADSAVMISQGASISKGNSGSSTTSTSSYILSASQPLLSPGIGGPSVSASIPFSGSLASSSLSVSLGMPGFPPISGDVSIGLKSTSLGGVSNPASFSGLPSISLASLPAPFPRPNTTTPVSLLLPTGASSSFSLSPSLSPLKPVPLASILSPLGCYLEPGFSLRPIGLNAEPIFKGLDNLTSLVCGSLCFGYKYYALEYGNEC